MSKSNIFQKKTSFAVENLAGNVHLTLTTSFDTLPY